MYPSKMLFVCILIIAMGSFSVHGADEAAAVQIAGKPADVQYPFIAEVTGNDIYVRSGKGTAYYHCSKVNRGDKMTVFEEVFGWAKVLPPQGCYSWIHKNYVDVEAGKPTVGVLNGDNVRVWAGSDYIEAMRSSSMQTKLNVGEIVELLPDQPQGSDYYKIKPPVGAYLWINCEYLKYLEPIQVKKPLVIPPRDASQEKPNLPPSVETAPPVFQNLEPEKKAVVDPNEPNEPEKTTVSPKADESPKAQPGDSENLKQCYALSAKIDLEVQKPLLEQNYTDIRKSLEAIMADSADSKAATYAQILLERIQRYELAASVTDTVKKQDEALAKARAEIEKAHAAKLEALPVETDFLYSGLLKVSHVYTQKTGQKRYLLQDSSGKILCYIVPATGEMAGQIESLVDTKVGIRGTVASDKKSLVTLISVSSVESLK